MTRGVKLTLLISIVLNMLLAGMLLGDVSRRLVSAAPAFDIQSELAKLPPDKRVLFNHIIGPAKKKMDDERIRMDDAKKEALRILKAEPFNGQAYLAQVQHINDLHVQMKRHVAEAVVELAKQLTAEQRVLIGEIISHPPFTMPPGSLIPLNTHGSDSQ